MSSLSEKQDKALIKKDELEDNPKLPSICIPRVDMSITSEYIEKIMNEVLLSENSLLKTCIERIDLVGRQNEKGEDYKRVFVHFKPWETFESVNSKNMRQRLLSGETVKIMYNIPSYWKCSASRVPRPEWQEKQDTNEKDRSKPYIVDDTNKSINKTSQNHNNKQSNKKKPLVTNMKTNANITNNTIKHKTEKTDYKPKWLGELSDIASLLETKSEENNKNINLKKKNKKVLSQNKTKETLNELTETENNK